MRFLRQNTAVRVTVGPFLDFADGVTPLTALTVTGSKLTFIVDDANVPTLVLDVAPTASGGSNDMVHISGDDAGYYDLELAAANVNYVGRAILSISDALTHCPVFHEFTILPANVYDSMVLGTDYLQTDVIQIEGGDATDAIPSATANADALLNRDMSAGTDTNARSPRNALRFLRNKWSISGTTLTVTKEDDTTSAWSSTVTPTTGADPITGNDPA